MLQLNTLAAAPQGLSSVCDKIDRYRQAINIQRDKAEKEKNLAKTGKIRATDQDSG